MNRGGPTVAQSLPVDRYTGNCLIKPSSSSYYCGAGGGVLHNAIQEPPRCRYDAVAIGAAAAAAAGYHHHHNSPPQPATPYQHYQQLQDWYGRTAYWHHHQGGGGVSGGPLVEKANFAAHKHGAPLIQAAKYNRTGGGVGGVGGGGPSKKYAKKAPAEQPNGGCKKNDGGSDESSGTASETSLPRIIKPRKRRKKERKPVPANAASQPIVVVVVEPERDAAVDRPSSSSSSPPPSRSSSSPSPPPPSTVAAPSSQSSQLPRDAVLPFDTVRLSADIKAVSLEDVSTCQCACCDPVGNVWDVGRRCFSPSLTRPEPARRSWSGEPASFPTTLSLSKSIAEYAKPEITAAAAPRARTHSLEVSSEIVTSHNGQRDIEIKFFTMPIGDHR